MMRGRLPFRLVLPLAAAMALSAFPGAGSSQTGSQRGPVSTEKTPTVDMTGVWAGYGYNCSISKPSRQIIQIRVHGASVVATKSEGDGCVHSGEVTWTGQLNGTRELPIRIHSRDVIGGTQLGRDSWADQTLNVIDSDTLSIPAYGITYYRFPCNDPNLPIRDAYDKADPKRHHFPRLGFICWPWESAQCTVDRVFDTMSRVAPAIAPTYPGGQRVANCATLQLLSAKVKVLGEQYGYDNRVRIVIDRNARSVTNYTLPGHIFYPGQIKRVVVYTNDIGECVFKMPALLMRSYRDHKADYCIMVETTGDGVGSFGPENELLGKYLIFADADYKLRTAVLNGSVPAYSPLPLPSSP